MPHRLTPAQLDEILAIQLTVAWAGEAAGEPARLGWWKTDLVDKEGGGDLFERLVPKTARWASLILVHAAARRTDELAREKLAHGDEVWTLFHLGFDTDEQVAERLAYHRAQRREPSEVLGRHFLVGRQWSTEELTSMLESFGKPKVTVTPVGRQLAVRAAPPAEAVPLLAAALLPLSDTYPLPYVEVEG